jgi:hypothetical protein
VVGRPIDISLCRAQTIRIQDCGGGLRMTVEARGASVCRVCAAESNAHLGESLGVEDVVELVDKNGEP